MSPIKWMRKSKAQGSAPTLNAHMLGKGISENKISERKENARWKGAKIRGNQKTNQKNINIKTNKDTRNEKKRWTNSYLCNFEWTWWRIDQDSHPLSPLWLHLARSHSDTHWTICPLQHEYKKMKWVTVMHNMQNEWLSAVSTNKMSVHELNVKQRMRSPTSLITLRCDL